MKSKRNKQPKTIKINRNCNVSKASEPAEEKQYRRATEFDTRHLLRHSVTTPCVQTPIPSKPPSAAADVGVERLLLLPPLLRTIKRTTHPSTSASSSNNKASSSSSLRIHHTAMLYKDRSTTRVGDSVNKSLTC